MLTYIGIGSNQGDPLENCRRAIEGIVSEGTNRLVRCSSFYRTEPVGKKDQNWFVNAVALVETSLGPREMLESLLSLEKEIGRVRGERWGPRVIDLDILFYGEKVIDEEDLQVPHPRLHERRFVLIPLAEIAPDLKHPCLGKTIAQILSALGGQDKVFPLREGNTKTCIV
jgi:2-amino-4-hydroxy-6-hydroxymethyldihydropteridine diphosphokinase